MDVTDLAYIDSTGYHYSDYPTFLAWLQEEYRGIYGADVYLGSDSQDGQFVAILAKAFYDTAALGAATYNSFSPVTAQGLGLARNVKINGLTKRVATYSTVDVACGGTYGTTVTGGVAIDELDQKWNLPDFTIPVGGTITVTATSQLAGAVNAFANTVNRIYTPTRGWQTVNNASAATVGVPVETDAELRTRQTVSTANPSLTVLDGTVGAVANTAGVTNVRGYENDTGSTDSNGIPAHKICIVVLGGDSIAVAETIALHKTPGGGTFGTTTELVYDAHGMPLNISFSRPTLVTITCTVTLHANEGWSSDYEVLIQEAIAAVINGFGIGQTVLITKLFAPAYLNGAAAGSTYDIVSLEIGKNMDPQSNVNIDIAFDELATCDATVDITVVVT